MRSIAKLAVLTLLVVLGEACVVVEQKCNPRNCADGCCTAAGQCVNGSAANACGNGGNACSVCPGSFICSLGSCQPTSGNGGGSGGGGGTGGGAGGGFTGGGGGSSSSGNVSFLWTFAGQSCAQQTQVSTVRVTIPGQTLANAGLYPCSNGGSDGIMLLNFVAGAYSYTLEALSSTNVVLFAATGTFDVNGNVTVNANLSPVNVLGSALVSWTFPPNSLSNTPNCTQSGVANVLVTIDSTPAVTVPCPQGFGASVRFDNLTTGSHPVVLEAVESGGYVYYRKTGTLTAQVSPAQNTYLLDWAVGSLPLRWTFSNGTTQVNCAQAGISTMNIVLRDSLGADVYGSTGVDVPCTDGVNQGTTFTLNGDTYTAYLQAYGTGSTLYRSNFTTPPSVTVINGQFPTLGTTTPAVLLTP